MDHSEGFPVLPSADDAMDQSLIDGAKASKSRVREPSLQGDHGTLAFRSVEFMTLAVVVVVVILLTCAVCWLYRQNCRLCSAVAKKSEEFQSKNTEEPWGHEWQCQECNIQPGSAGYNLHHALARDCNLQG